jgi:hypothetical protein
MSARSFNAPSYKYGFNGMEKDDEVFGGAMTAEYWEYDIRLGRRWNRDKVVKSWESGYTAFSNNPIIFVDPNGNDDYYNRFGKYLGSDGSGTAIRLANRITTQETFNKMASTADGIELLKSSGQSQEVKIMEGQQAAIENILTLSQKENRERAAFIVLDVENATLSLEVQPYSPTDDDKHKSANMWQQNEDKTIVPNQPSKVVVGQVHGHPQFPGEILVEGVSQENGKNITKGETDEHTAKSLRGPVYAVDKNYIHKVDQNGKVDNKQPKTKEVLVDALETSGGKPAAKK